MRSVFLILIFVFLTSISIPAQQVKTKDDYLPVPAIEQPLTNFIPQKINPETGLWISSAGALLGISLATVMSYNTLNKTLDDPGHQKSQMGVPLIGLGLTLSAVSSVLIGFFLDEIKESKSQEKSILKE